MKTSLCFALCVMSLAGCTNYKQTHLENGEVGYSIQCYSYRSKLWNACYIKAGDICGVRGYEVLSKSGDNIYRDKKNLWIKCK